MSATASPGSSPAVITEPLGGSALSRAARGGQVPQWYAPMPRTSTEWAAHASAVAASVDSRWLAELEPAIAPRGAAGDRLRRAAQQNGVLVTTGQQPGLFGGPLMTFNKALSARAHADVLQEVLGIPVAPVFWAATDDADFEEAAGVSVALDGGARELRLESRTVRGVPMAQVPLGDEIEPLFDVLRGACGSAPHASYLAAALREYRAEASIGDAYVALLREVLEPLEISVLDASHPALVRCAEPLLQRAVATAEDVALALRARNAAIVDAGFAVQVEEVPGLSLVFVNQDGEKHRLSLADAAAAASRRELTLSSTVLLRPVVERALLPTVAYVGGPAEVAYFAQASAVAAALSSPVPLTVPRWSATLIEPRVRRTLDELGLDLAAFGDPHAAERIVAASRVPADSSAALGALRDDLTRNTVRLAEADAGLVPPAAIEGFRRALEHRVERLERRYLAGVKRRERELMNRVATARGSLYPHGVRQERKLAFTPFLARYGRALIDDMLVAARTHARAIVHQPPTATSTASPSAHARV